MRRYKFRLYQRWTTILITTDSNFRIGRPVFICGCNDRSQLHMYIPSTRVQKASKILSTSS